MSRKSISELLYQRGIDDPGVQAVADEADYMIGCLESRLTDLEAKFAASRRAFAAVAAAVERLIHTSICPVCGAIGDEPCDAGLHG